MTATESQDVASNQKSKAIAPGQVYSAQILRGKARGRTFLLSAGLRRLLLGSVCSGMVP